ncbi:MAG TPA: hypothetical protein PLG94_17295 [Smithellaceae bacterium]|nr:hypothetical protein [Smithellaceae bacterium]
MSIWTLAELTAKVRSLTGRKTEGQLSSADIVKYINNYYQGIFPELLSLEKKKGFWEFETSGSDEGPYPYDASIIVAKPPVYCIGGGQNRMRIFTEPEHFYHAWPRSQAYQRSRPRDCLIWRRELLIAPPPDGVYVISVNAEFSIVTPLTEPADVPEQDNWGPAIAYGAAIEISLDKGDDAKAADLSGPYKYYLNLCTRREVRNLMFKRALPRF